ncbi:MAG: glycosyltransferase family 4 protein [Chloroflexi bacterium]|nr:glycosyltransferase family 4 protein [Chloroflexota bacterium]
MRLCVVSGTFHPEPGGPPTFLYRLLPELIQRGHSIHVVTYGERDAPTNYPYAVTRISRRQPIPLRLIQMSLAILRVARNADAIFISDYGLPVAIVNLILRKPTLLKNVGDFAWEFSTRHDWIPRGQTIDEFQIAPHSPRVNFLRVVQRWYTAAAATVVAPSRYSASLVAGWGIDSNCVRVIYNALDPMPNLSSRDQARRDLNINFPLVLTVARLAPWKNVDKVIRALKNVREKIPNARLVVIGDGPEYANLQSLISNLQLGDAVTLLGAQPHHVVQRYLRAADVFVLFSTYEGLPHTVLEAMQAETPVIVSDAGGNLEVVENGISGWVANKNDEAGLAAAIAEVIAHPESAAARAKAASTKLDRFSWSHLMNDYDRALQELIA